NAYSPRFDGRVRLARPIRHGAARGGKDAMLFCSKQFFLFFAAVFALHWAMPWHRLRVVLLVVASFYFYASWNKWLALIICATTCMDYVVALGIERCRTPLHTKLLLGV